MLKLSADFAFQNFFSKSSVDAFILLKSLYLSKISAQEKIELAINKIITDLQQNQHVKKVAIRRNLNFRLILQLVMQFLVPLTFITFRMCHEFGAKY